MDLNLDGAKKAEEVKKLHQSVKEQLERTNAQRVKNANKGRKPISFEVGEWVWLHMRPERFPDQRKSKLSPCGDGPFKILEKINDNAYKLELPGELKVSATFNVSDLARFDVGNDVLGSKPLEEGGSDEDIETTTQVIQAPLVPSGPVTRTRSRTMEKKFNMFMDQLGSEGFFKTDTRPLSPLASKYWADSFKQDPLMIQDDPEGEPHMDLKPFESSFQNTRDQSKTPHHSEQNVQTLKTYRLDPLLADNTNWPLIKPRLVAHLSKVDFTSLETT